MPTFNNLDSLTAYLQERIDNSLTREVLDEVRTAEQESIESNVYGAYTPAVYERRQGNGGLIAEENIVGSLVKSGTLEVRNETPFNDTYPTENNGDNLIGLVEYGDGWNGYHYDYPPNDSKRPYKKARHPIQKTVKALEKQNRISLALKKALKARGIVTK